ncbi:MULTISPECIES: hypothetical protein [unclassified Pseudomonas]|jgi:hypothetical protein|uniref:hypothetical protein n=1 Tax=unclassified Pseudomonas TaxID=196821 RepID=UPI000DADBE82|nr:hypothetical protein [Pseudomonas sp. URMO17WK12:I6]PZW56550.1 hypothetical protein F475_04568 [Pseudomonas sp. URMO17WK12:I6]
MPRLSALSNPTGLIDIEKSRITIILDESAKRLAFSLARLDLSGIEVHPAVSVVVIVKRGNSEERVYLGEVSDWNKGFVVLSEIADEGTWLFRVLLVQAADSLLVAAAENIRPDGQGDTTSFIALEPAELGQRPWEIQILESDGRAILRFNKDIYHSSVEAEADKFFTGLILPEVVRRLAEWLARDPAKLSESTWEDFKAWLLLHGITDEPSEDNEEEQADWSTRVTAAFCNRFKIATQLLEARKKEEKDEDS